MSSTGESESLRVLSELIELKCAGGAMTERKIDRIAAFFCGVPSSKATTRGRYRTISSYGRRQSQ